MKYNYKKFYFCYLILIEPDVIVININIIIIAGIINRYHNIMT